MKKSQFHPSRNNLNTYRKIPTSLKNSYPCPLPKNSLTITETTSNIRTKSQPFPKSSQNPIKISQPHKNFSTPPPPPPKNFSTIPRKLLKNPDIISTALEKISTLKNMLINYPPYFYLFFLSTSFPSLFKKKISENLGGGV